MNRLPFQSAKEKQFVLTRFEIRPVVFAEVRVWQGAADREAIVVISQERTCRGKRIARVKAVVSQKLEHAAVILVGPAFGNDIYLGACVAAVFGREIRGFDLYFLNEINADVVDLTCVAAGVVIVAAIYRE